MSPLKGCTFLLAVLLTSSMASAAQPPLVMRNPDGSCASSNEICGDGIDEDCDGVDLPCSGLDKDRDGFNVDVDCDDLDRNIYPSVQTSCLMNGTSGTRLCQANGAYTPCTTTPLCEAVGTGKCYYVSATSGKDTNNGSFQAPWKTYKNVTAYYRDSDKPATFVQLKPGDVVYFLSGVYKDIYFYENGNSGFFIANLAGSSASPIKVKAYPGARVMFSPNGQNAGFHIFNSSYIEVDGIEIAKSYQSGVRVEDSHHITLSNLWVHDTDGVDNNNLAGVYLVRSSNVDLVHSLVHDNYDRTCADTNGLKTSNSRNMVLFEGGNNRVLNNVIFQTPPRSATQTGQCVVYKHGQDLAGGIFEVAGNVFKNCWETAVGNGGYGGRIHHNLLVDSDAISVVDHGGLTPMTDNIIEFNTVINGLGLIYNPTQALDVNLAFGPLVYRKNIVIHDGPYNSDNGGIIKIDPYGKDTAYTQAKATTTIQDNCYYSPTVTTQFGFFSYNSFAGTSLGGLYNFTNWKGQGFDLNSTVSNPLLSATALPGLAACQDKGIYAK